MSRRFLFPRGGSTLQNAKTCVCLTFKPFNCANQYRVEGERAVLESVLCMWLQTSEIHTSACCQARGSLSRSTYFLPGGPGPGTETLRTWPVSFCSLKVRGQCQPHGHPVTMESGATGACYSPLHGVCRQGCQSEFGIVKSTITLSSHGAVLSLSTS